MKSLWYAICRAFVLMGAMWAVAYWVATPGDQPLIAFISGILISVFTLMPTPNLMED